MNLHEYQAKKLFAQVNLPVSTGIVIEKIEEIASAIQSIGGNKWVVKVQVHAGGRGKAGGVTLVDSIAEAEAFVELWLHKHIVTYQTDEKGQIVNRILIEPCMNIMQELYCGMVVDRTSCSVVAMLSTEGGVEIEKVAEETPEKILYITFDHSGANKEEIIDTGVKLGFNDKQVEEFVDIFLKMSELFIAKDFALIEINPLIITDKGHLFCLDAKVSIDSNALYRHPDLQDMKDPAQEDSREAEASAWELNYVALDGNVGCMVNGAGLAMGTMDAISLLGGSPANFLDVGGTATPERVAQAFRIITQDKNV